MALSERIKQTCEKALDEEMQFYKSSKRLPTVKLKGLKSYCFFGLHVHVSQILKLSNCFIEKLQATKSIPIHTHNIGEKGNPRNDFFS